MMEQYLGNRHDERFTYRRVKWPELIEVEDYGYITSGKVDYSAFSTVKATCSFDFTGELPDTVDAVRIIYSFKDDNEVAHETKLGTFLCQYSDVTYESTDKGLIATGTAEGSSVLSVAANRIIGYPLTVPAGTNAVSVAVDMLSNGTDCLGLQVIHDDSDYCLTEQHTFDSNDTYLTAVNWLLSAAGFSSADVSVDGVVLLRKYIEPTKKPAYFSFANDERSIMQIGVKETSDYMTAPNVVRMSYESENECLRATAKAISGSRNSLLARGNREITLFESVSELDGSTASEKLEDLKQQALKKLLDNGSDIIKLEWEHAFVPISTGDSVSVLYSGKTWNMNVTNISVSLKTTCPMTTQGRTFVDSELSVEVDGDVLWEAQVQNG